VTAAVAATIVCGVADPDAAAVLETAGSLAAAYRARLVVVHAFDEPVDTAEDVMDVVRSAIADDRALETRLVEGEPAERLLEAAQEEGAAFLVVGSRGRGALAGSVLGSVSQALVRTATCPLVVVPPDASPLGERGGGEGSIVCGVDGSDQALAAVRVARQLGERLGSGVAIVHASRTARSLLSYVGRSSTPSLSVQPDSAERQSLEILERAVDELGGEPALAELVPGDPAEVLRAVAARERAGLIVVAARGVGGAHAVLLGSVAVALIGAAEVPIVVLPEAAEAATG